MKRKLIVGIVAVIILVLLTGCNESSDKSQDTSNIELENSDTNEVINEVINEEEAIIIDPNLQEETAEEIEIEPVENIEDLESPISLEENETATVNDDEILDEFNYYIKENDLVKAVNHFKKYGLLVKPETADYMFISLEENSIRKLNYYSEDITDNESVQLAFIDVYNNENNSINVEMYSGPNKNVIDELCNSGMKIYMFEGYGQPIVDYSFYKEYGNYTEFISDYISVMAKESDEFSIMGPNLVISYDELIDRIVYSENVIMTNDKTVENETMYNLIYEQYKSYIRFYTISLMYMEGYDSETFVITDELLSSYKHVVSEYPTTSLGRFISDYLVILEDEDFKMSHDLEVNAYKLHENMDDYLIK